MIARMVTGPHIALDAGGNQAAGTGRGQQQVIDAQAGVAGNVKYEMIEPLFVKNLFGDETEAAVASQ